MATLNATLSLTSTDVSSSQLSFTVTGALGVGTPNIGMSREVATITSPTTLVPSTTGTKYCYIKHLGVKSNGVSASTNTVNLQTITTAPTRETVLMTFTQLPASTNTITPVVAGKTLDAVTYTTSVSNTFTLLCAALAGEPDILSATFVTTSTTTVVTILNANLGDSVTITCATTVTGGVTITDDGSGASVLPTGSSHSVLRAGEFIFMPVKSGEGLSAISAGGASADACMLEYSYWTKSVE